MKNRLSAFAFAALGLCMPLAGQAQTEIQWWHSMTAVNGEWVNDLARQFNESQKEYKVVPTFTVENGVLKGTQTRDKTIPAANGKPEVRAHAAVHGLELPTKDSVVEAKIRFDGATMIVYAQRSLALNSQVKIRCPRCGGEVHFKRLYG